MLEDKITIEKAKSIILERFNTSVKGRRPDTSLQNKQHDGKEGHWLEIQMGIDPNGNNDADLLGFEMKNQTTSGKTTFGDWSADEYIFIHGRGKNPKRNSTNIKFNITRDQFFEIFGTPNPEKNNRLSWSGSVCPTFYGDTTKAGQSLDIDKSTGDIIITYCFSLDERDNKTSVVPQNMQLEDLIIARWKHQSLKIKVENKFDQNGWFKCIKNSDGIYSNIHFGKSINFELWMQLFTEKVIFFDSGMYMGNIRPYSQWRAMNTFWDSLIIEKH